MFQNESGFGSFLFTYDAKLITALGLNFEECKLETVRQAMFGFQMKT